MVLLLHQIQPMVCINYTSSNGYFTLQYLCTLGKQCEIKKNQEQILILVIEIGSDEIMKVIKSCHIFYMGTTLKDHRLCQQI